MDEDCFPLPWCRIVTRILLEVQKLAAGELSIRQAVLAELGMAGFEVYQRHSLASSKLSWHEAVFAEFGVAGFEVLETELVQLGNGVHILFFCFSIRN